MSEKKTVKILIKEPYTEAYVKEVEDDLKTFQEIVGGYIECVEMPGIKGVNLFVNEEGKLLEQEGNFWLPEYEDCAVGTCYMIGFDAEECENVSLTDQQTKQAKLYTDYYAIPEGYNLYLDYHYLKDIMDKKFKLINKKQAVM